MMKKIINFVLTLIFILFTTMSIVNAGEQYDYSSFEGEWHKVDPDKLYGDILLNIIKVTDNKEILFSLDNGENITGTIQNNKVEWTEEWYDGSMELTLTFYDDYIHLQYSRYSHEWYSEIVFVSNTAKPRKITTNDYCVILNGQKLEFDQPPVLRNDRILVPLRTIFESMNADVYYDGESDSRFSGDDYKWNSITAIKNDTVVQMYNINDNWSFTKTNLFAPETCEYMDVDVNPIILNGRTLVPVRIIAESFGAQVSWDDATKTVSISADTSGERKTAEEIRQCDDFTWVKAVKIIENMRLDFGGDVYAPPKFDINGKFFSVPVFDNYSNYLGCIRLYHTGKQEHYNQNGQLTNTFKNNLTYDYNKILTGDLSDFSGIWYSGEGDIINLHADGTEGKTYIKPSNGVLYRQIAEDFSKNENGEYIWGVMFDFTDEENGSYAFWLYPVGVDVIVGGKVVATDTSRVRLYAGHDFYPSNQMENKIFYMY